MTGIKVNVSEGGASLSISFGGGPKGFKFPLEDISAGNFWTKLTVNSWTPLTPTSPLEQQNHDLAVYKIADIWLPMPLNLGTAYNQNFTETEDVMVNRGLTSQSASIGSTIADAGVSTVSGIAQEVVKAGAGLTGMNASAKMAKGSIANQQMGLVYDGASLRAHTFSWRMTPKNPEEQKAIESIVRALKGFATPATAGIGGGEVQDSKEQAGAIASFATNGNAGLQTGLAGSDKTVLRAIGRLGIPPTVSVEFWYKDAINPHLFRIKDSFILSVDVNYTPTGTWNAYMDGAPVETQLTLNIKETSIVTQSEIQGGF